MVKAFIGARVDSRLLTESDPRVEIPVIDASRQAHWTLISCVVPSTESRWRGNRHWRWRRDSSLLECVQQGAQPEREQERPQLVHQHSIELFIRFQLSTFVFSSIFQNQKKNT